MLALSPRFLRFATVGALGFLVDCASVLAARPLIGLTAATVLAYFVAATANFAVHRAWTFRHDDHRHGVIAQWARYLLANSAGFALNRGTVFSLYAIAPLTRHEPALALAAGAAAGLLANYMLSKTYVFSRR